MGLLSLLVPEVRRPCFVCGTPVGHDNWYASVVDGRREVGTWCRSCGPTCPTLASYPDW